MTVKTASEHLAKGIPVSCCGSLCLLNAIIKRFSEKDGSFFYQAEISDSVNLNSVLIVSLDSLEQV